MNLSADVANKAPDTALRQAQKSIDAAIDALHHDVTKLRERLRPALLERPVAEPVTGGTQAAKQLRCEVITTMEQQHALLEQLHQSMQALLRDVDF